MNRSVCALAGLLVAAATAIAQDSSRLYTQPSVPADEVLQRLNLKLGWRTYIPMDGRRDSIYSVQAAFNDKNAGDVLLVQTRSGLVCAVEAETGRIRWQARVGRPYHVSVPLGYNSENILVVNDQTLYVLDRENGDLRWDFDMPSAVATAPVADDNQVFLTLKDGTVSAYAARRQNPDVVAKTGGDAKKASKDKMEGKSAEEGPRRTGVGLTSSIGALASATGKGTRTVASVGALTSARQASQSATSGFEPRRNWSDASGLHLELAPIQTDEALFLASEAGRIAALAKGLKHSERYNRVLADAPIIVPPGQYGEFAFVASQDSNLYSVYIPNARIEWRFTTGTPIVRKPAITDDDVFITTDRGGLRRLDQKTGREIWKNSSADRFVATNNKFVYATDRSGRLLLLDRARGTQLGSYDARDFVVPIANELTDRLYLAANNGLMICIYDRDYAKPKQNRKVELRKPGDKKRGEKMEAKPEGKPKPKAKAEAKEPGDDKDKGEQIEKKP